jgi:hypothetical protein
MGRCIAAWHSGQLVEALIAAMGDENVAYRAEYILQNAGCPVKPASTRLPGSVFNPLSKDRQHVSSATMWRLAQTDYVNWL